LGSVEGIAPAFVWRSWGIAKEYLGVVGFRTDIRNWVPKNTRHVC